MCPKSTLKRFWNKVKVGSPDECWEWQGATTFDGYGCQRIKKKVYRAHRVSWMITNGPIPHDMSVLHSCDNPPCVNPNHLWIGTPSDNQQDSILKGRDGHGTLSGEALPQSKLTTVDVIEVRRLYATGKVNKTELGKMFNVQRQTCHKIIHRQRWKHVL